MRIGIDIDGCITNEDEYRRAFMDKYCLEKGYPYLDDPYGYEIKASWWTHKIEDDYRSLYQETYFRYAIVRYGCKEVLNRLKEEGHEIYLITGRYPAFFDTEEGKKTRAITREWLMKNEIPFDKLVFTGFPKTQYIKAENVDVMIEDYEGTIRDCVKEFPTYCFDNSYNRGLELENMTRIYSWYDFYRKFHERQQ